MNGPASGALTLFEVGTDPQKRLGHIDADAGWSLGAMSAVELMAATGREFQAVDVAERFKLPDPPHHSAWGRLFSEAHRRGVIVRVGATQSRRRTVNRSLCVLWRGAPAWTCQATAA